MRRFLTGVLFAVFLSDCGDAGTESPSDTQVRDASGDRGSAATDVSVLDTPVAPIDGSLPSVDLETPPPDLSPEVNPIDQASSQPDALSPPNSGDSRPAADATNDAAPAAGGVPINPKALKILPSGTVFLRGVTAGCSSGSETGSPASRWCAFGKIVSEVPRDKLELWVMNMSKLPPTCDGSSADCIKLTDELAGQAGEADFLPEFHRFYGDTLIFYASAHYSPNQDFVGGVYAWRPGWPGAQLISPTKNGTYDCVGHAKAPVAICIDYAATSNPTTIGLYAGRVDKGQPLAKVAAIYPLNPNTPVPSWYARFSHDGKYFAYSTGSPPVTPNGKDVPETLYYVETDKIGVAAPTQIGEPGLSRWEISPDDGRWFYLRDFNYHSSDPSGTLYMADFPSGNNPIKLSSDLLASGAKGGVGWFSLLPTSGPAPSLAGIEVLQNVKNIPMYEGDPVLIRNPTSSLTDPTNVVRGPPVSFLLPTISPDLKYLYYSINSPSSTVYQDAYIWNMETKSSCTLSAAPDTSAKGDVFSRNGDLTFWALQTKPGFPSDAWVAHTADCVNQRKRFATRVASWFLSDDDRMLLIDDVDNDIGTLRVAEITSGELTPTSVVQTRIRSQHWTLLPNQEGVLYTVIAEPETSGVYFYKLR
jgi:hypothetical protein